MLAATAGHSPAVLRILANIIPPCITPPCTRSNSLLVFLTATTNGHTDRPSFYFLPIGFTVARGADGGKSPCAQTPRADRVAQKKSARFSARPRNRSSDHWAMLRR